MDSRVAANLCLFVVSAIALGAGAVTRLAGVPDWANWIWLGGSIPVLVAVLIGMVRRLLRRDAGLDIIAVLSIAGALGLGEYLTGAVIALMLASGRALEDYAEARARQVQGVLRPARVRDVPALHRQVVGRRNARGLTWALRSNGARP